MLYTTQIYFLTILEVGDPRAMALQDGFRVSDKETPSFYLSHRIVFQSVCVVREGNQEETETEN